MQSVTKSVNGNDVTIKYNENGFPIFDDHALVLNDKGETVYKNTSQEFLNMSHEQQKLYVMKTFELPPSKMKNYTMHHNESIGEVQLVNIKLHNEFKHSGGMSIWGRGHTR